MNYAYYSGRLICLLFTLILVHKKMNIIQTDLRIYIYITVPEFTPVLVLKF